MDYREMASAMAELVACGDAEVAGKNAAGEPTYRLTEQGKRSAEDLIRSRGVDPDEVKRMSLRDFAIKCGIDVEGKD